jgi:4a-hydroxytetrahydrobiopterin dehydratase
MAAQKLTPEALDTALKELTAWSIQNDKLRREYRFPDFAHAFGFMTTAAIEIEKRNHHPEWSNVYNRVTVDLTTHDSKGITQKDVDLARLLEQLAAKLG